MIIDPTTKNGHFAWRKYQFENGVKMAHIYNSHASPLYVVSLTTSSSDTNLEPESNYIRRMLENIKKIKSFMIDGINIFDCLIKINDFALTDETVKITLKWKLPFDNIMLNERVYEENIKFGGLNSATNSAFSKYEAEWNRICTEILPKEYYDDLDEVIKIFEEFLE